MSTTTPYLGLTLYNDSTDQSVTFATFRAVWGGPAVTSNFYKIDTGMSSFNTRITNLENASGAIPVSALFISSNFYQVTGVTGISAYNVGQLIVLSLDTTSSGTVTLDINSLGTKSVMKVDSTGTAINLTGSDLVKNRRYLFVYDGTRWTWVSANSADQIQIVGTSGNVVTVGSTNNLLGTTTQAGLIADTTHAATGKTTPVDADEIGLVDSAASNVLKKLTWANLKATIKSYLSAYFDPLAIGTISNGKISVTVSSNDLVIALKTLAGTDPTSTDSVRVNIAGSVYTITSATSITIAAGTNWFNSGSSALQTLPVSYFLYMVNDSGTPVLSVARKSHYTVVESTMGTTTDESYLYGYSGFTNGDNVINIGYFEATLSAGAGYTWSSVANVSNQLTLEGNWLSWTPVYTALGTGTPAYGTVTNAFIKYKVSHKKIFGEMRASGTTTGSTVTSILATLPFQSKASADASGASVAIGWGSVAGVVGGTGISSGTPDRITLFRYDLADMGIGAGKVINVSFMMEI